MGLGIKGSLTQALVPRGIHYNILVTFLQHFCNNLLCVGNPKVCVKYSKALQNCYKYVANMILVCLCTVDKSGVENVLCLCLKSVANGERNYIGASSISSQKSRIFHVNWLQIWKSSTPRVIHIFMCRSTEQLGSMNGEKPASRCR